MQSFNLIPAFSCAILCMALSCMPATTPEDAAHEEDTAEETIVPGTDGENKKSMTINITVGGKTFKADIEDSDTGRAFVEKLSLTLEMQELNGNEKYCYGVSLPRADKYCESISAGDLMLYSGNCIVLFYGPAGGYNYTRIGKLKTTDGLAAALGRNSVSVRFEKE